MQCECGKQLEVKYYCDQCFSLQCDSCAKSFIGGEIVTYFCKQCDAILQEATPKNIAEAGSKKPIAAEKPAAPKERKIKVNPKYLQPEPEPQNDLPDPLTLEPISEASDMIPPLEIQTSDPILNAVSPLIEDIASPIEMPTNEIEPEFYAPPVQEDNLLSIDPQSDTTQFTDILPSVDGQAPETQVPYNNDLLLSEGLHGFQTDEMISSIEPKDLPPSGDAFENLDILSHPPEIEDNLPVLDLQDSLGMSQLPPENSLQGNTDPLPPMDQFIPEETSEDLSAYTSPLVQEPLQNTDFLTMPLQPPPDTELSTPLEFTPDSSEVDTTSSLDSGTFSDTESEDPPTKHNGTQDQTDTKSSILSEEEKNLILEENALFQDNPHIMKILIRLMCNPGSHFQSILTFIRKDSPLRIKFICITAVVLFLETFVINHLTNSYLSNNPIPLYVSIFTEFGGVLVFSLFLGIYAAVIKKLSGAAHVALIVFGIEAIVRFFHMLTGLFLYLLNLMAPIPYLTVQSIFCLMTVVIIFQIFKKSFKYPNGENLWVIVLSLLLAWHFKSWILMDLAHVI